MTLTATKKTAAALVLAPALLIFMSSPQASVAQEAAAPGQTTTATTPAPTMTKSELKAQKKSQKAAEKAAKEQAKAQKDSANALKHQDKATDASEKVGSGVPATTAPAAQPAPHQ